MFPKWGHLFLNYEDFLFYGSLSEGDTKNIGKITFFEK